MQLLLEQHPWILGIAGSASLFTFLATFLLIPLIVVRMRPDYFSVPHRGPGRLRRRHPVVIGILTGLKNVIGAVLVVMGVIMLVTPGQGLLSILAGMTLMNYPGKYRFERWLVTRPSVWRVINWIRRKANVEPLAPPAAGTPHDNAVT